MLSRFIWFIRYIEHLERGYFFTASMSKIFEALKVIAPLYLSKMVIDAAVSGESANEIIVAAAVAVFSYFMFSFLSVYFLRKAEYHTQKFAKKHHVQKSLAILSADYEYAERDEVQNEMEAIKQLERTLVTGIVTFRDKFSSFLGSLFSITISAILIRDLFFVGNLLWSVAYIVVMIMLHWLVSVIDFGMIKKFGDSVKRIYMKNHRYLSNYSELLYNYKIEKDLRLYGDALGRGFNKKYNAKSRELYDLFFKLFSISGARRDFIAGCIMALTAIFVGIKALDGSIGVSSVFLCLGLLDLLFKNIEELVDAAAKMIGSDSLRKNIQNFFYGLEHVLEKEQSDEHERELLSAMECRAGDDTFSEIEFCDVSFKYPNSENYVLKHINLKISGNKKVALVGENGSGKTTLIKLLLGLYAPTEGKVLINGRDTSTFSAADFTKFFSSVFQDFKLFAFRLDENVAFSESNRGERVRECLEKTGLGEFVKKHDLDSYLYCNFEENGVEVSGGEAQKIAIARALYHSGKFFVLDEPTAALDPISEYEIYKNFSEITLGSPVIYISHRLSSCIFCDMVVVLENGEVAQIGTHAELLKQSAGAYSTLWNAQAKHYNEQLNEQLRAAEAQATL